MIRVFRFVSFRNIVLKCGTGTKRFLASFKEGQTNAISYKACIGSTLVFNHLFSYIIKIHLFTGPLLPENLRVLDIPQQRKSDLSVSLSGKYKVYPASKGLQLRSLNKLLLLLTNTINLYVAMSDGK